MGFQVFVPSAPSGDLPPGSVDNVELAGSIELSKIVAGTAFRLLARNGSGVASELAALLTQHRLVIGDANGQPASADAITPAMALISNSDGVPTHGGASATELSRISGLTANAQTQIDSKPFTLIQTYAPSGANSIDFNSVITAAYDRYFIPFSLLPGTDDVEFWIRRSTDNGVSFDAAAGNYRYAGRADGDAASTNVISTSNTQIHITHTSGTLAVGNASNEGICGEIWLTRRGSATLWTAVKWSVQYVTAAGNTYMQQGQGFRTATGASTALQILPESGTISGAAAIFGVRTS